MVKLVDVKQCKNCEHAIYLAMAGNEAFPDVYCHVGGGGMCIIESRAEPNVP